METRRYSEVRVFHILKEVESGMSVINVAWEHRVSPAIIHYWKRKYSGVMLSKLKRLKALEEGNTRLKRVVVQQALGGELLREINSKKMTNFFTRRSAVNYLVKQGRNSLIIDRWY